MPAQSATNGIGAQTLTPTHGVGPFHGGGGGGGGGSGSGYNAGFDQGQSQDAGGWDNSGWDNSGGSDNSGWGSGASDNNSGWGDFGGSDFGGGDWGGGGDPGRASWEAVAQASGGGYQNLTSSASPELTSAIATFLA